MAVVKAAESDGAHTLHESPGVVGHLRPDGPELDEERGRKKGRQVGSSENRSVL